MQQYYPQRKELSDFCRTQACFHLLCWDEVLAAGIYLLFRLISYDNILWYLYSPRGAECQSCFGTDVMKCSAGRFNTEDLPLHLQAQMPHSFSLPRRMIGCSLAGLMLWDVGPTWSVLSPGAVWSVSGWQALASVSFWLLFIRDVFSGRIPVACAVGFLSL